MKNILFKKRLNPKKRMKSLSVTQRTEEKDCITRVRKSFLYFVTKSQEKNPQLEPPVVHIHKSFDSKRGIERFRFQVKGKFFVTALEQLWDVHFQHTLKILISWKTKVFSPKNKSEILT